MDITRQTQQKPFLKRYWLVLAGVALVAAMILATRSFGSASYVVDGKNLVFGDVKRGEFSIQIRGLGVLAPKNVQWVAANVDGRVEKIAYEAGAQVKQGDVLATLSNRSLKEEFGESTWELEAVAKENRASQMSVESDLANLRADAKGAQLDYESAQLKVEAEQSLVESGIVSKLTFGQSKLAAAQHKERIASQRERVTKMESNLAAMIEAHTARVNKLKNSQNLIQQKIDDLSIRAPIDGVVQAMALKLGQQVTPGTEAARIAPHDNLVALLDVQDFQARDLALGQAVSVDTRSSKIAGKITRIEPTATNGVVKVEVALDGTMPPEARPDLSVEGVIDVERKPDALFVTRPSYAQSHSKVALYRVEGDIAQRVNVELGRASTRQIEVREGLKEGDRIIVSDPSAWESHDNVLIR